MAGRGGRRRRWRAGRWPWCSAAVDALVRRTSHGPPACAASACQLARHAGETNRQPPTHRGNTRRHSEELQLCERLWLPPASGHPTGHLVCPGEPLRRAEDVRPCRHSHELRALPSARRKATGAKPAAHRHGGLPPGAQTAGQPCSCSEGRLHSWEGSRWRRRRHAAHHQARARGRRCPTRPQAGGWGRRDRWQGPAPHAWRPGGNGRSRRHAHAADTQSPGMVAPRGLEGYSAVLQGL
mmetsp:Transcript_36496/g.113572  ORF Transcript_36496/g.113572 Transcript_36496/m.113572 type:complete len:239 (+) Transcript_36496:157-873(+)